MEKETLSRRSFFSFALAGFAVVPFLASVARARAADSCPTAPLVGKPMVKVNEGMAKTLHYVELATKAEHPKYKAGAHCANCKFFNVDKIQEGYAPCTMMGMKFVSNCGWCASHTPKA